MLILLDYRPRCKLKFRQLCLQAGQEKLNRKIYLLAVQKLQKMTSEHQPEYAYKQPKNCNLYARDYGDEILRPLLEYLKD